MGSYSVLRLGPPCCGKFACLLDFYVFLTVAGLPEEARRLCGLLSGLGLLQAGFRQSAGGVLAGE